MAVVIDAFAVLIAAIVVLASSQRNANRKLNEY